MTHRRHHMKLGKMNFGAWTLWGGIFLNYRNESWQASRTQIVGKINFCGAFTHVCSKE